MFKSFNEITDAAVQRLNGIVNQIDVLCEERQEAQTRTMILSWLDGRTSAQEDELQQLDIRLENIANELADLDEARHEVARFLENFTNAVEKSSDIQHFMLFLQGYDAAYVYGDAPDTHPWH